MASVPDRVTCPIVRIDTNQGVIRLPFCMQWPGHVPGGQVYGQPIMGPTDIDARWTHPDAISKVLKADGADSILRSAFKPVDFLEKPQLEGPFCLVGIQSAQSSALPIKRNMVTGDIFASARLRDILHENAFSARMSAGRITEIQAGQRVLEGRCGLMWRTNGAAITAVLDEGQFEFQLLQKFTRLVGH